MATAWEIIADGTFLPDPHAEWIQVGQKLESRNGEMIAYIAKIEPNGDAGLLVWLTWTLKPPKKADFRFGQTVQPWTLQGLYEYWHPV